MNNWKRTLAREAYWESLRGLKNEKAPNWKPKVKKVATHMWMNANFGKPKICEMIDCPGKSQTYDWSLKHGKPYEKKRENFWRLCRSCHKKYDWKPAYTLKAIKNLKWYGKSKMARTI